jgi:hypothetical protein
MNFFGFLWLVSPEVLILRTTRAQVDADSFDASLGELELRPNGAVRWLSRLDLLDPEAGVGSLNSDRFPL